MSVVFSLDLKSFITEDKAGPSSTGSGFSLKGEGDATAILIHGLTGTPNEMKYLANHLNKSGYSVICPCLANHGGSIRVLKNSKWQDFYNSVRSIMTEGELAEKKGPIFVAGLSMGALLALMLADEFNDRVSAVCCLAPTLFYDGWNTPWSKYFLPLAYNTFLKHFFYFKEEPPYGIKNETIRQRIHKYYSGATLNDTGNVAQYGYPYFPVALLYQLQLIVKKLTRDLSDMRFPVQLIQAKDDDMASVKNSKFVYDRIGSEVKEMVFLYDSYHVITADYERDIVAEKMEGFFSRVAAMRKPQLL